MKLNVSLNDKAAQRFQAIKQDSGAKEFQRIERTKIHRVFLPNNVYSLVKQAAEKRGQTIYEYVQEITEDLLKQKTNGDAKTFAQTQTC